MTDIIEIRARRRAIAELELTILDSNADLSEVVRLRGVLEGDDSRVRRIGEERRLQGYVLGALVDMAVRAQLGPDKKGGAAFIRDFARSCHEDADEPDAFDPESFDLPDDCEAPESSAVIDDFVRECEVVRIHEPSPDRVAASLAGVGFRFSQLDDEERPHFVLRVVLADDRAARLFDGEVWATAYSL